jgi:pSer/pThr/pTyr-binding forkhead associated (FHA) protein
MTVVKRAILKVMMRDKVLEVIPLHGKLVVLGREKSDIVLDDTEVSASHCQVQQVGDDWQLFDLHSTNGTFVNGQRIVKNRLVEGDRIRVGKCEFVFGFEEQSESSISFVGRELDPARYPVPENDFAKEIDDLLSAERSEYLHALRIVAEVSYHDGIKETLDIDGEVQIGRLSKQGRFARDEELSRKHARIFVDDDAVLWVEDLGSTNGVIVNSSKISRPTKVQADDVIRAGRTRIKVKIQPGSGYTEI